VGSSARVLGLALSGGGHRAALFHIGVLARLAELDFLRKVRVISTVSGGSIVGALYYLLLREQLQTNTDAQMTPDVYLNVVRTLDDAYRKAIATSFRGRALARPGIVRMVKPSFSRTNLIAEVFEERLYRAIVGSDKPVQMPELLIKPLGNDGKPIKDFKPLSPVNDARDAPVPILVLNSTTLNTAHSFRFEAEYVGEPEAQAGGRLDVDKNTRLIRVPYQSLPDSQRRRFTLGFAVSASAAFPVGFAPLVVDKLYGVDKMGRRTKYLVRLTDGGVRDNQGIDGLLDAGCTDMLISDGSSPTADIEEPAGTIVGVLPRVLAIGGKESREQRVYYAFARDPNAKVKFMHLQTGLQPPSLDPLDMRTPADRYRDEYAAPWPTGLDPDAQLLVSRIRTDLDAFSDVECFALEEVGYRAADVVLGKPGPLSTSWPFTAVRPALDSGQNEWTQRRLRVAEKKFFKPLSLMLERIRVPGWARILLLDAFPALFLLAGIASGGVLVGGNVSVPTLYGVLAGLVSLVGFLAVLYLKAGTRGFRLLSRIVFGGLLYVPLIPILYVGGWLMVGVGSLHVRLGRIRAVPG